MTMPAYTTALFDLDGTLIDSSACIIACMRHAFAAHGFAEPTRESILARMGVPLERSIGMLEPRATDASVCEAVIATYRAKYREVAPSSIVAFAGIDGMLATVRNAGVRVAVVTSKKTGPAEDNCRALGLDRWIEVIIGSDAASKYKPDAEPALAAMRRLGVVADRNTLVVGDASFDLEMGRAAGVSTCGVTWGAQSEQELRACGPDHVVRSVAALSEVLLG
jgi:phosphoglycolate phosphatase